MKRYALYIAITAISTLPFLSLVQPNQVKLSADTALLTTVKQVKATTPVVKTAVATPIAKVSPTPMPAVAVATPVAPTPTVAPTPVYASGCSSYLSIFQQYNWSVQTAVAICQAESSGNPYALSPTCDRGLMQINCVHSDMVNGDLSALYDPATNIAIAYRLYAADGWYPWSTYKDGAYAQYL